MDDIVDANLGPQKNWSEVVIQTESGEVSLPTARKLKGPYGDVYVIGTVHVSQKSCDEVQQLIRAVKPRIVLLELCRSRENVLHVNDDEKEPEFNFTQYLMKQRQHGAMGIMEAFLQLTSARISKSTDMKPGKEFRVAAQEASNVGGTIGG
eukprot:Colp12_sorted_trinity150504_noHs@19953